MSQLLGSEAFWDFFFDPTCLIGKKSPCSKLIFGNIFQSSYDYHTAWATFSFQVQPLMVIMKETYYLVPFIDQFNLFWPQAKRIKPKWVRQTHMSRLFWSQVSETGFFDNSIPKKIAYTVPFGIDGSVLLTMWVVGTLQKAQIVSNITHKVWNKNVRIYLIRKHKHSWKLKKILREVVEL